MAYRFGFFFLFVVIPFLFADMAFDDSVRYIRTTDSKSYKLDSPLKQAHFNLSRLAFYNKSGPLDSDNKKVKELLNESLQLAPEDVAVQFIRSQRHFNLGLAAYRSYNYQKAIQITENNWSLLLQLDEQMKQQTLFWESQKKSLANDSYKEEELATADQMLAEIELYRTRYVYLFQENMHLLGNAYFKFGVKDKAALILSRLDESYLDDFGQPSLRDYFTSTQ